MAGQTAARTREDLGNRVLAGGPDSPTGSGTFGEVVLGDAASAPEPIDSRSAVHPL